MIGAFKNLDSSNVFLTTYVAKKSWTTTYTSSSGFDLSGIEKRVVSYKSDYGEAVNISFYTGSVPELGATTGSFDINLQSTISIPGSRNYPTGGNILIYSIPRKYIGTHIEPGTFFVDIPGDSKVVQDNKEGVMYYNSSIVGDIMYNKGIVVIYDTSLITELSSASETVLWKSNLPIHTYNVNCSVKDKEFNYTYNRTFPSSLLTDDDATPYVTSIGLYNSRSELVAVAKVSRPIKKDPNVDFTYNIKIDV